MSRPLLLLLHAHLPFVRHPETAWAFEETWLFEALTETYFPLLDLAERLHREGFRQLFALSLSPTLVAMWRDPLLQRRYLRHLDHLESLMDQERARGGPEAVLDAYAQRLTAARVRFHALDGDLAGAFARVQDTVELLTTGATHGLLPLLRQAPGAVRGQIAVAVREHTRIFGHPPRGFWLPECGYYPGVEEVLADHGLAYFCLDHHALPPGVAHAARCPNGVAALARDPTTAERVWSARQGYPAHPAYRDFHADIGYQRPPAALEPLIPAFAGPCPTGLKYRAIGGGDYDPVTGRQRAQRDAEDFIAWVARDGPICLSPYDAELFGHWWHEGVIWLEAVLRAAHADPRVELTTPATWLANRPLPTAQPLASTWGAGGHHRFWLNPDTQWIYPRLHQAAHRLARLRDTDSPAFSAATRSLLLAQASDWPFLIHGGTAASYARRRVTKHLARFDALIHRLEQGKKTGEMAARLAEWEPVFPDESLCWLRET